MKLRYGLGGSALNCLGLGLVLGGLRNLTDAAGIPPIESLNAMAILIGVPALFFGGILIGYGGRKDDEGWSRYVRDQRP